MNLLESKNIKYVIRIKNNCIPLDKNKNKNKNRNNKIINEKPNNIRFVSYIADVEDIKKIKKNESVKIIKKIECNIATNLDTPKKNMFCAT